MKPIFTGCACAIITPFRNGHMDLAAFRSLIELQLEGGCSALVVAGTTGESATLEYDEHLALVKEAAQALHGRIPLIAGAGSNSTAHALRLIRQAEDGGADALLLVTPYYNKTSQSGLLRHYTYLADRTELPILLYNVPSRTGMQIAPETLRELSAHPQIVGLKEAASDLDAVSREMSLCPPDFSFYSGNDSLTLPMLSLGAKGVISVAANLAPAAMTILCQLGLDGRFQEANAVHFRWLELMQSLFLDVNPIPVKAAMGMCGLCSGELRLPLQPLTAEQELRLRAVLERCGLLSGAEKA